MEQGCGDKQFKVTKELIFRTLKSTWTWARVYKAKKGQYIFTLTINI